MSGQLDVRGALAVDPDVRVGFEASIAGFDSVPGAGTKPAAVERLVAAVERFCVNVDTLRSGVGVHLAIEDPSDRS